MITAWDVSSFECSSGSPKKLSCVAFLVFAATAKMRASLTCEPLLPITVTGYCPRIQVL